jgi:hypothetical protein
MNERQQLLTTTKQQRDERHGVNTHEKDNNTFNKKEHNNESFNG